jgi:hypothetical protein
VPPAGHQKLKAFSGSFREGISSEIELHSFNNHQKGSYTIKSENGAIIVDLNWGIHYKQVTLLEAENQGKGTIYELRIFCISLAKNWLLTENQTPGSLVLDFTVKPFKGTLDFTANGSKITRQLEFVPW